MFRLCFTKDSMKIEDVDGNWVVKMDSLEPLTDIPVLHQAEILNFEDYRDDV